MKTEIKEIRIGGYKFVLEITENGKGMFTHTVFLGGIVYHKAENCFADTEDMTKEYIQWTFKR